MAEDDILQELIRREGGTSDHPADRGGLTRWGITRASWEAYLRRPVSDAEMRAITVDQALAFYRSEYVERPGFDKVADHSLRELLVDAAVNHGIRRAAKWAQRAVGVKQDGILGPLSLAAINAAPALGVLLWVVAFRTRLYGRLVSKDSQLAAARKAGFTKLQAEFAGGWNARAAEFLEAAARRIESDHNARRNP